MLESKFSACMVQKMNVEAKANHSTGLGGTMLFIATEWFLYSDSECTVYSFCTVTLNATDNVRICGIPVHVK